MSEFREMFNGESSRSKQKKHQANQEQETEQHSQVNNNKKQQQFQQKANEIKEILAHADVFKHQ